MFFCYDISGGLTEKLCAGSFARKNKRRFNVKVFKIELIVEQSVIIMEKETMKKSFEFF